VLDDYKFWGFLAVLQGNLAFGAVADGHPVLAGSVAATSILCALEAFRELAGDITARRKICAELAALTAERSDRDTASRPKSFEANIALP
jgi:hypothetical protein